MGTDHLIPDIENMPAHMKEQAMMERLLEEQGAGKDLGDEFEGKMDAIIGK